jgi:putative endonuclease
MGSASNDYYVYIVTNNTRSTLYIGVTSDLRVRVWQHRAGERPDTFSQRYHCVHLVYHEHYRDVRDAIAREKQLKRWRREKKNTLIATLNPQWEDLAADWFDAVEPQGGALREDKSRDPSTGSG